MPNAGRQLLPEAGARHERTLEAVSCTPLFGAGSGRDVGLTSSPPGSDAVPTPGVRPGLCYSCHTPPLNSGECDISFPSHRTMWLSFHILSGTVGIYAQHLRAEWISYGGYCWRWIDAMCLGLSRVEPVLHAVNPHEDGEQVSRCDVRDIEVIDILDFLLNITEPHLVHPSEIEET